MEHALPHPDLRGSTEALTERLDTAWRDLREKLLSRFPHLFSPEDDEVAADTFAYDDDGPEDDASVFLPEDRELVVIEAEEVIEGRLKKLAGLLAATAPGLLLTNYVARLAEGGVTHVTALDPGIFEKALNSTTFGGAAVCAVLAIANVVRADRMYDAINPDNPDDIAWLAKKI